MSHQSAFLLSYEVLLIDKNEFYSSEAAWVMLVFAASKRFATGVSVLSCIA
ncbi:MAG: hypothetical protein HXO19_08745 [Prevotella shahii]|jgi:hypothetical protein|nr:hypothetical protein [Hoylesella shahii]